MPDTSQNTWLDYVVAIGAIATPIMMLILTAVGWKIRHAVERRTVLEASLRDDRINVYNSILEPFTILFSSDAAWKIDPQNKNKNKPKVDVVTELMVSLNYRKQAQKFCLIGDDAVVRAYNDLMHTSRNPPQGVPQDTLNVKLMEHIGTFLLEIRRSMGNERTSLKCWDMIEWFITDSREKRPSKKL